MNVENGGCEDVVLAEFTMGSCKKGMPWQYIVSRFQTTTRLSNIAPRRVAGSNPYPMMSYLLKLFERILIGWHTKLLLVLNH
jgi:hypothetical protein